MSDDSMRTAGPIQPPLNFRFRKGVSANPTGRPKPEKTVDDATDKRPPKASNDRLQ